MSKKDAEALAEMLDKGLIVVAGDEEGAINLDDDTLVFVGIIFDVSGYGPHSGSIYAMQNRYHNHVNAVLEAADEIHEDWMREHYSDHLKELYQDARKKGLSEEKAWQQADESFRENMQGYAYKLTPMEAFEVIRRDKRASKYIHFYSAERNIKIKPSKK